MSVQQNASSTQFFDQKMFPQNGLPPVVQEICSVIINIETGQVVIITIKPIVQPEGQIFPFLVQTVVLSPAL